MAEELRVVITAKDGASRVFKEVGAAAGDVGKKAEEAGEKGERGFKRVGDSAKKASIDSQTLSVALTAVGAALSYAGSMAMQQERQLIALNRAFGENADEVIRFAEELDDLTIFSDDDIRAGQRFFASLQNNYDMSIDQIKVMMTLTAELAAASGVSFENASSRVTAAIRGEGEAIEWLGLTMNQQSIDRENLTLTMSNQEAAQFRLNALLEQSAPYIGTNNAMMQTSVGTITEWQDKMQDAGAAVGGFLGPVATLTSGLGTLGLGITGITTGFAGLGKAASAVRTSMASGLLASAITPMGLAVTGLAIGVGVLTTAFLQNRQEAAEARAVIATLKDAYLELQAAANNARMDGNTQQAAYLDQLRFQVESVRAEADLVSQTLDDASQFDFRGVEYSRDDWFALKDAYEITDEEAQKLAASQQRLGVALQDSRIDGEALASEMDRLYWQFVRGEITADEYILAMDVLSQSTSEYAVAVEDAAFAQELLNKALADGKVTADEFASVSKAIGIIAQENAEINRRGYRDANESNRERRKTFDLWVEELSYIGKIGFATRQNTALQLELNQATEGSNRERRKTAELMREEATATQLLGMDTRDLAAATVEAAEARERLLATASGIGAGAFEETITAAEEFNDHMETVADNLERLMEVSGFGGLEGGATNMRVYAMEALNASSALETVFRATVGNTNAIANQSQAIADWAEELIGVQGEYSKLDDLVKNGRITGQSGIFEGNSEYAQAQRAFNDIARENAEIQEHVLTIQAKQAPLVRDQLAAYEDYMQEIADMPAQQQLITLGWMDSTAAMRAMEFQTLAVAAANGELGENGEAVFTSMITGAAQADPVLKALLLDMGLIEEGADGTITVNLAGAEGARSEISMLTEAIVALIDLTDDGEINGSFSITAEDNATPVVDGAVDNLDAVDGSNATVTVSAVDNASSVLNGVALTIAGLDGTKAVTYIETIFSSQGVRGQMNGGVVDGYADGGVVIRAAEVGPEILHYANGGTAVLPYDGLYSVPVGSYISPAHASASRIGGAGVSVTFTGNFYGSNRMELDEWADSHLVPAFVDAINDERRGQVSV